jgi:hypothetical protein
MTLLACAATPKEARTVAVPAPLTPEDGVKIAGVLEDLFGSDQVVHSVRVLPCTDLKSPCAAGVDERAIATVLTNRSEFRGLAVLCRRSGQWAAAKLAADAPIDCSNVR